MPLQHRFNFRLNRDANIMFDTVTRNPNPCPPNQKPTLNSLRDLPICTMVYLYFCSRKMNHVLLLTATSLLHGGSGPFLLVNILFRKIKRFDVARGGCKERKSICNK